MTAISSRVLLFLLLPILHLSGDSAEDFNRLYTQLLQKHVYSTKRSGVFQHLIDYQSWKEDSAYPHARSILLQLDLQASTEQEELAYFINLYNFLTIDLIIREGEQESIRNLGSILQNVWKKYSWTIAGRKYTLHSIEHDILRSIADPRIHFALVCASVSCPNIRKEAYRSADLHRQLDDDVRNFLASPKGIMRQEEDTILISRIFSWYAADFGGRKGVIEFINMHTKGSYRQFKGYLPYDWSLNAVQ